MGARLKISALPKRPDNGPDLAEGALLDQLRQAHRICRCAAQTDLYEACAVLALDRQTAQAAALEGVMRCLPQALSHAPLIYLPGVEERSFDEAWLLRLISAARAQDHDSFTFLLHSRIPPLARRQLAYLIGMI
ncbi:MAG: hypothetical protein AAF245_03990 [Pseudomonadota bacterium]